MAEPGKSATIKDATDPARNTYASSLLLLQQRGFTANTFIDIGAAEGAFFLARVDAQLFPSARHFFVDAMRENEEMYRKLAAKFHAGYEIAALTSFDGEVAVRIDPDFYNTHIDHLQPATSYETIRRVSAATLDGLVERHRLEPPFVIKLDVQGGELDVLRGALRSLDQAVIVLTEIQTFAERDTLVELLAFMQGNGWTLYDLTDQAYYLSNSTLYQCYATFIPKSMDFRKDEPWCTPEQAPVVREQLRERRAEIQRALEKLASRS